MNKTILIPRGIPASGKSTWANALIDLSPEGTVARINNDDIVAMTFGKGWRRQPGIADTLQQIREKLLEIYIKSDTIETIIIDNTNLNTRTVRSLEKIANKFGYPVRILDDFLNVPLEVCVERDSRRESPVGEDVIRKMHKDASKLKPYKTSKVTVFEPYEARPDLDRAYIFDIDGTLAHMNNRGPYDISRVSEDTVDVGVREILWSLSESVILIVSGRKAVAWADTVNWLEENGIAYEHLYMRGELDDRPDYLVKYDIFNEHIRDRYNVLGVFDDRDQVVDLWRNKLKIKTYQVAEGDF